MRTATCPVLSFTSEVETVTRWFAQCYRIEVDAVSGYAEWKRCSFPAAGNVGEQDSRLHHGLEACAMISNELLLEDRKAAAKKKRLEAEKKNNG